MKIKLCAIVALCSLMVSCASHMGEGNNDGTTLRATASAFDKSTEWTITDDEVESNKEFYGTDGISERLTPAPKLFAISQSFSNAAPVYPRIEGAFSLDTAAMPVRCMECAEGFAKAYSENSGCESWFESGSVYGLVMLDYDFKRLYGESKISWYAVGEGICIDECWQVPVRLFFEVEKENTRYTDNHADVMLYIRLVGSDWKIVSADLMGVAGQDEGDPQE
ncbi:MAG: hypothetical protein KBS64_02750 [Treponema sp.]|nr:hypothetical protein [Candidatus Treponema equi]